MESSQQAPRLTARQKLLIKLLAFLGLALLLYIKPRVEAWVESRQQNQQTANEKPAENPSTSGSPWKKSGSSESTATESGPAATRDVAADDSDDSSMADGDAKAPTEDDLNLPEQTTAPGTAEAKQTNETAGKVATSKDSKQKKSSPRTTTKTTSTKTAKKTSKPPESSESNATTREAGESNTAGSASSEGTSNSSEATASKIPASDKATVPASKEKTKSPRKPSSVTKMERTPPVQRRVPDDAEKSNPPPAAKEAAANSDLGRLKEVDDNVFESSAGLIYLPGSADGHRLRHVMEHAKDDTSKEIHGVYDGDRDAILAVIDEAFLKARQGGPDVRSEKQNGRRIYTVNLKRRIGQVGGQQGERQGNPDCRYLRLVLENDVEVVTAYPSKSF